VNRSSDWDALVGDLEPWVTIHGLLMVVSKSAFGVAVVRAQVMPQWTRMTLVTGVILVAFASVLPSVAQTICGGVRDLGFAGLGLFLLTIPHEFDHRKKRSTSTRLSLGASRSTTATTSSSTT
jgi:hypothetical protein